MGGMGGAEPAAELFEALEYRLQRTPAGQRASVIGQLRSMAAGLQAGPRDLVERTIQMALAA
eukprot:8057182-Lingulodinium_polyedra.AAC.1